MNRPLRAGRVTDMSPEQWIQHDAAHLWHPYSASRARVWPVVSAHGTRLTLADGRELIDGMSSWWAAIHGYNHPRLNAAIHKQTAAMAHVMFGGLTHPPAVELAGRLVALLPGDLNRVFFCDSGSVSVEVAIKMALQYWQGRGEPQRSRLLTIRGGYHGDTFGAMSLCDPERGMHTMFRDILPRQIFVRAPMAGRAGKAGDECDEQACRDMERALAHKGKEIAAVIIEPIVQGAGGMRIHSAEYVTRVRELCDRHNTLLILDEIATGFGRLGELFACAMANITPDIICLGKSLSAGYLSLAATVARDHVAEGIDNSPAGALMHGPTYMANPLACAVAIENLNLLETGAWRHRVAGIEAMLRTGLAPCRKADSVADVRVKGAIGVVQMCDNVNTDELCERFVAEGVWLRPFADMIYTMPPFVITDEELKKITAAIRSVLSV